MGDKKKVLLVDDSMAIRRQLEKIVEGSGDFSVCGQASNGVDAVKLYSSLKPDLVFMDIVMPDMDGLQAIRTIVSLDKAAKIVVVSSAGGVGEKVAEALKFGAKNVVSKPFDPEKIVEMMRTM